MYWVAVDGELPDVLDSSARLVEKFRGRKICEEERRNAEVGAELLKEALKKEGMLAFVSL